MKTSNFLVLFLLCIFSLSLSAQRRATFPSASSKLSIKQPIGCKKYYNINLKSGSVREPNHVVTTKASSFVNGNGFNIRILKPIKEGNFIWAQFPFKPGYPSGKIVGLKVAYKIIPSPNNNKKGVYISQERIVQGPSKFKGVVKLDDPTNLYGSGAHSSATNFACGNDYKTVGFKIVGNPGDRIIIQRISVLFDCPTPGPIVTFKCPPNLPNPKVKLTDIEKSGDYYRFKLPVANFGAYPNYLFSKAPTLPACGANANASRSWVEIRDHKNNYLYGFCAFGKNTDLKNVWFAVKKGKPIPPYVRVIIKDRGCNKRYVSNRIPLPQNL